MTHAADSSTAGRIQDLTRDLVLNLMGYTHPELPAACERLGLPAPPAEGESLSLTKRERLTQVFTQIEVRDYSRVIDRFIEEGGLTPEVRNHAQDLVWAQSLKIVERVRRDIADALEPLAPICSNVTGYLELLRRLFVLDRFTGSWDATTLEAEVVKHTVENPEDWTVLNLFEALGALRTHDRRFALLVEGFLSGPVNPYEPRQRQMVAAINPLLQRAGLQIVESGSRGGYPEFKIVAGNSPVRPVQLVLFASISRNKPDLRISEVLDRKVEILDNHKVLGYDRVVATEQGLTWSALLEWWAETNSLDRNDPATKLRPGSINVCSPRSPKSRRPSGSSSSPITDGLLIKGWRTSQLCCPRSGFIGTRSPSSAAATRPFGHSHWTSCSYSAAIDV